MRDLAQQCMLERVRAERIDYDERLVVHACPAQRGGCTLHTRILIGQTGVVVSGNGALLVNCECARGIELDLAQRFRSGAALCREGIATCEASERNIPRDDGGDRLRPDIARRPIAHAVARAEGFERIGSSPQLIIAEAQVSDAIIIDLDNEVAILTAACERVVAWQPPV